MTISPLVPARRAAYTSSQVGRLNTSEGRISGILETQMPSSMWIATVALSLCFGCTTRRMQRDQPMLFPHQPTTFVEGRVSNRSMDCLSWAEGTSAWHLVPELSRRDTEYDELVAGAFARSHHPTVILRMSVQESSRPEWFTGIRKSKRGMVAFVERANTAVWYVRRQDALEARARRTGGQVTDPPGPRLQRLETDYREADIDARTLDLVVRSWEKALSAVEIPAPGQSAGPGLDGATYHFAQASPRQQGRTWSPEERTPMAALITIGEELAALAASDAESRRERDSFVLAAAQAFLEPPSHHERRPPNRCPAVAIEAPSTH